MSVKNNFYKNYFSIKDININYIENKLYKDIIDSNYSKKTQIFFNDMLGLTKIWRHIKGYPANGQKTHTNSNTSKKNKILLNLRIDQFFSLFGKKKRNIFPTLIQAEYNNRLWYKLWKYEWLQGYEFAFSLVNDKKNSIPFDPVSLAKGQVNGFLRLGNAAKIGKAKKITKSCTIGVPLLFTKYIYMEYLPETYPYRLTIADDLRKKMGKKSKKNKKK